MYDDERWMMFLVKALLVGGTFIMVMVIAAMIWTGIAALREGCYYL